MQLFFQQRHTLLQRFDLQHNGVGRVDMVELVAAEPDDAARNADDRRALRYLPQHDGVGRDARVVAHAERPEDLCARADHDVVAERGMSLADILARAAERHALIQQTVVADLGRLADDDAGAVVDDEAAADRRAGVNFDAGPELRPLGHGAGDEKAAMAVKPVRDAVIDRCVQAVIQQDDLNGRPRGGVVLFVCADILQKMQIQFLQYKTRLLKSSRGG